MEETTYISVKKAAENWNLTPRRVQQLCKDGQIPAAARHGREWLIPKTTEKPVAAVTPPLKKGRRAIHSLPSSLNHLCR